MGFWDRLKKIGFKFRITLPWPGERKLPKPKIPDKPISKEEIMEEIKKEVNDGSNKSA